MPLDVDLPTDLVDRALQLPAPAKVKLAGLLLDAAQESPADAEQVRQEWREVITQRVNGYLSGTIPAVDAAEALARIEEQFEEKHRQ
jgi:hypothetical protein